MRRVGKGFSGVETPLFDNMLEVREVDAEEEVQVPAHDDVDQENVTEDIVDDILKLKARVKKLERLNKVKSSNLRRLKKVGTSQHIESSEDLENVFNQERKNVDIDEGIELVVNQEKDAEIKGRQEDDAEVQKAVEIVTTAKLMTEVVTAATTQVVAASTPIPTAKLAVVDVSTPISAAKPAAKPKVKVLKIFAAAPAGKGILVEDPKPIKKKYQIEMDAEYARKLQEEEESHVQAKDVQAKGIQKVPVVNYEIVMINNKPRYKIIRADDTHQLYTSFITLLKNFDRVDLEDLWKIMKARFSTSKPTNFFDDYLLVTLKTMFEKTDAQDVIWRSQQTEHGQALVKSWKLLTSCGVHIITFTTTVFALLLLELMLLKRSKENTKCVTAAGEELTAAKHKLILLV
nr:hypothetical protein [Tanacetum cinerariifolium]